MLDAADGRVDYQAARKPSGVIHHIEQILNVPRIVADEPRLEILNHLHCRLIGTSRVRLSDTEDSLIGQNFHIDPVAATGSHEERLDVRNFHRGRIPDLAAVERLQAPGDRPANHTSATASSLTWSFLGGSERRGGHQPTLQ